MWTRWTLKDSEDWDRTQRTDSVLKFSIVVVDFPVGEHSVEFSLLDPSAGPDSFVVSAVSPFIITKLPDWRLSRSRDAQRLSCKLLVDAAAVGATHFKTLFVGIQEDDSQPPKRLQDLTVRKCRFYRVVDVSDPEPWQKSSSALLTGVGPIDADGPDMFFRFSEEILGPLLVNRYVHERMVQPTVNSTTRALYPTTIYPHFSITQENPSPVGAGPVGVA